MPDVNAALAERSDSTAARCDACGHAQSAHDLISTRWCAATSLGVGSRACICSTPVAAARRLNHY